MSIVVDFPAPFGPSSATVSPGATATSIPRTARTSPNDLARLPQLDACGDRHASNSASSGPTGSVPAFREPYGTHVIGAPRSSIERRDLALHAQDRSRSAAR